MYKYKNIQNSLFVYTCHECEIDSGNDKKFFICHEMMCINYKRRIFKFLFYYEIDSETLIKTGLLEIIYIKYKDLNSNKI